MTGKQPLWDELFEGFENAIADVRQTVVEEPWFGRAVTTAPHAQLAPDAPGTWQKEGVEPSPEANLDR